MPISGQVLLDGEPLTFGQLLVVPSGSRPAFGKLDKEGRFTLMTYNPGDGLPMGEHRVSVNAGEQISSSTIRWHAPKKYSDHNASGLTIKVDGKLDDVVLNLTWDGKEPYVEKL